MGELESNANLLLKTKSALVAALDEIKAIANNEAKERVSLLAKYRNLEHEADGLKQEVEQRIHQKEEEFASTKKNFAKALEGMQMALEAETKGKVEALRMKKKLEADVLDLGIALEHANAANAESQKNI